MKFETLEEYDRLANELLLASDKATVEQTARLLALYVGYYQRRYGLVDSQRSAEEQLADSAEGMRVLAAALTLGRGLVSAAGEES